MAGPEARGELPDGLRQALPPRFEAVGEALASGTGSVNACWEAGRELASMGASLGDALDGLRTTSQLVRRTGPDFSETRALSVAWSEGTLAYLHSLSCEDPLTGLASHAHVRLGLSGLYRDAAPHADDVRRSHALVVVESIGPQDGGAGSQTDVLVHALQLARAGKSARSVFAGSETIGRVGVQRVVVVAARDPRLAQRVALLRRMVDSHPARVWIEGLPGSDAAAAALLDELARL